MPREKKISIIIQARLGSKRFPKKMIAKLGNHKLIEWVIDRSKLSNKTNNIILATTNLKEDKLLLEIGKEKNINVFAGEENNVLKRFYDAAKYFSSEIIVRVCGDNPFISHQFIDELIEFYLNNNCDMAYNHQTIKDYICVNGFGAEILSIENLSMMLKKTNDKSHLEHLTKYMWDNRTNYRILGVPVDKNFMKPLRFDVDFEDNLIKLNQLVSKYGIKINTSVDQIINFKLGNNL